MTDWPHSRARLAWNNGDTIEPEMAELWDAQIAASASGDVWTDVSQIATIVNKATAATGGSALGYDPSSRYWYSFNVSTGDPVGVRSRSGREWQALTIPAGAGLSPFAFAANGTGTIVVGGLVTSTNQKFRQSTDGSTWNTRNSSQNNGEDILSICWVPQLSLFVAGHTAGVIETSPDGITWTSQTVPNSNNRSQIATNGSIIVATAPGTTSITSTDGVTWTQHTSNGLGAGGGRSLVWSAYHEKFFAIDGITTNGLYSSSDGITWSASGLNSFPSAAAAVIRLAVYGRMLLACYATSSVVRYAVSLDGGVTFLNLEEVVPGSVSVSGFVVSTGGQLMISQSTNGEHYSSLRGGYY